MKPTVGSHPLRHDVSAPYGVRKPKENKALSRSVVRCGGEERVEIADVNARNALDKAHSAYSRVEDLEVQVSDLEARIEELEQRGE